MQSRLLSNSRIDKKNVVTPSQSRIIQRKQIEKRLQNLSMKQFERVSKNLVKQNQKLKEDVRSVTQKLNKLKQSKKFQTQHKRNPPIQEHILRLKRQLEVKYDTMRDLKQKIRKQAEKNMVEQVSTNMKQKKNEIISMQRQIETLNYQKQKLMQQFKQNQIDFQQYLPTKDLTAQLQIFKQDNRTLKKKVYDISVIIKDNERTAKEALTKIYTLKRQDQGTINKFQRIKSLSVLSKPMSRQSGQMKSLQEEVKSLKRRKQDVQNQLQTQKSVKQSAKFKMQKQIRQLLEYHKRLFKRRVRELTQLNYLQKKQAEQKSQKQIQIEKSNVPTVQKQMQTENIIKIQYRKDWVGQNQGILFDDSQIVQFKENCLIKCMFVYRTSDHIVFIKFGYENPSTKLKYETKVPFDKESLKKMQAKKVTSKTNGHLINLTVSVTKNIITKIESIWSDGDSSVQGWESEQSDKYKFDIMDKERPISFFGTVVPHPKGFYALESLGCEILEVEESLLIQ